MNKLTKLLIISMICYSSSKAQDVITNFINNGSEDLKKDTEKLIEGYMAPFGEWFGTGLNAGWYNTGQPHQFPGFDVTAGIHFIRPPENAGTFTPDVANLFSSENGDPISELPTFIGNDNETAIFYKIPGTDELPSGPVYQKLFNAPGGYNIGSDYAVPMPYVQGSIGIIKQTEILFRFTPKVDIQDLKMGFWGIGVKHDIKQWIPGINELPFNLSFAGGYSKLTSQLEFDSNGQELNFNVSAFNSNLVLSKKLSVLTPYIGVGYQYSKSFLELKGDYIVGGLPELNGTSIIESGNTTISDPFSLSFGGVNGFKANAGARLKLFLFTIHVEYTMAEYNLLTVGIGLNSDIGSKLIGN